MCLHLHCPACQPGAPPLCRLGRQGESIDRLYQLLEWCAEQEGAAAAAEAAGSSSSGEAAAARRLWGRRFRDVLLTLVNRHCRGRQYIAALTLLDRLLQRDDADAAAWQEAALVQALLGDTAAAAGSLQRVEQLLQRQGPQAGGAGGAGGPAHRLSAQQRQRLLHRNRGLLSFLEHDYRGGHQGDGSHVACGAHSLVVSLTAGVADRQMRRRRCAELHRDVLRLQDRLAGCLPWLQAPPGSSRPRWRWTRQTRPPPTTTPLPSCTQISLGRRWRRSRRHSGAPPSPCCRWGAGRG